MPVLLSFCLTVQQPSSPPPPAPPPAKRTVEFTGTVLMNGFYNSARTNNSDDPVFADTDAVGEHGIVAVVGAGTIIEAVHQYGAGELDRALGGRWSRGWRG